MAEIPFEPYTNQGKLRFWCQKVLPLVYDDSLSYYELLNKVVEYLNNTISDVSTCEDNITALRDAFVQLQDYVNEMFDDFEPEIERIIDEMIDSGEFGEILTDIVNGLIAGEYSTTQGYAQFDYVLKDGILYCATASTSGEWDATKWRETTVGADMQLLNQRVYNLNAGQVEYNSENTYNNATVGKELQELKGSLNTPTTGVVTAPSGKVWTDDTYFTLKKTGGVISLSFYCKLTEGGASSGWVAIGTIPTGFRPPDTVYAIGFNYGGTGITDTHAIRITTTGTIQVIGFENAELCASSITYQI